MTRKSYQEVKVGLQPIIVKKRVISTWNLTEKTSNQILNLYHVVTAEVEHGYASSLPGPFILESESYTQTRDLKQGLTTVVQSEINGAPSNYNPSNRRLKTNNRKPQGNR